MYRLTTPEQRIKLPEDVNPSTVSWIRWTYAQGGRIVLEKRLADVRVEADGFAFDMTQAETKAFKGGEYAVIQIRFGIGSKAYASKKVRVYVEDVLNDTIVEVD